MCQTLKAQPRDLALFSLAIDTSLRSCDLLSLQVQDIATLDGDIREAFYTRQSKTRKGVKVELSVFTQAALQRWLQTSDKQPSNYLFTALRGSNPKPISSVQFRVLVKKWVSAIGLDPTDYSTHSLRRTKAVLVWQHCRDINVVRILLGHSSTQATCHYLGLDQDEALAIARQVSVLPTNFETPDGEEP